MDEGRTGKARPLFRPSRSRRRRRPAARSPRAHEAPALDELALGVLRTVRRHVLLDGDLALSECRPGRERRNCRAHEPRAPGRARRERRALLLLLRRRRRGRDTLARRGRALARRWARACSSCARRCRIWSRRRAARRARRARLGRARRAPEAARVRERVVAGRTARRRRRGGEREVAVGAVGGRGGGRGRRGTSREEGRRRGSTARFPSFGLRRWCLLTAGRRAGRRGTRGRPRRRRRRTSVGGRGPLGHGGWRVEVRRVCRRRCREGMGRDGRMRGRRPTGEGGGRVDGWCRGRRVRESRALVRRRDRGRR